MENVHIKKLEITNFKCFQSLKINQIKQINLIGGKNNIGKTALLEAIELLTSSDTPYSLIANTNILLKRRKGYSDGWQETDIDLIYKNKELMKIYSEKQSLEIKLGENIFKENNDDMFDPLSRKFILDDKPIYNTIFKSKENYKNKIFFIFNERKESMTLSTFITTLRMSNYRKEYPNYINSSRIKDDELSILYGTLVDLDRELFLDKSLKKFDNNLIAIKQKATKQGVIIKVKTKNRKTPIPLSSLGDGISRYISILSAIWANKDGFLFIDEIENGIHYSNHQKLWQLIFQASQEANCQIFATTHSKECIQSFNQVQLENKSFSSTYFELYKNIKIDKITAAKRTAEQLEYALTHQGKIRGE